MKNSFAYLKEPSSKEEKFKVEKKVSQELSSAGGLSIGDPSKSEHFCS